VDSEGNSLDIDVIDTGDLDRNINAQYHSYFNINKLMVDDLWELIGIWNIAVTKKGHKNRHDNICFEKLQENERKNAPRD
jgi:hypothetical protein